MDGWRHSVSVSQCFYLSPGDSSTKAKKKKAKQKYNYTELKAKSNITECQNHVNTFVT